jgi:hypothetical protein
MTVARIVALALALCACTALAQERTNATLVVEVTDPTGARIPGAQITATDETTGSRFEGATDLNGHAAFHLDQGIYKLRVGAKGFAFWEQTQLKLTAESHRNVILRIPAYYAPPIVQVVAPILPEDHQFLVMEIPLIPMQQFVSPDKPLRRRFRCSDPG